jgi:glycosylphosphatidylinositol transamidase (GPIT) subunit GPI8
MYCDCVVIKPVMSWFACPSHSRYHEIFFMIDTCQANTMYSRIYSPNIVAAGSSEKSENSYSVCLVLCTKSPDFSISIADARWLHSQHHTSSEIGVAVIDRFTYFNLEYLEDVSINSKATLQDLFSYYKEKQQNLGSTAGWRTDLFPRPLDKVGLITGLHKSHRVSTQSDLYNHRCLWQTFLAMYKMLKWLVTDTVWWCRQNWPCRHITWRIVLMTATQIIWIQ